MSRRTVQFQRLHTGPHLSNRKAGLVVQLGRNVRPGVEFPVVRALVADMCVLHALPVLQPRVLGKLVQHAQILLTAGAAAVLPHPGDKVVRDSPDVVPVLARRQVYLDVGRTADRCMVKEVGERPGTAPSSRASRRR